VNLNVISWLGVWFVKREMYEQSIRVFRARVSGAARGSEVAPHGHVVLPTSWGLLQGLGIVHAGL